MKNLFSMLLLGLILTGCSTLEPTIQADKDTASETTEKAEQ